MPPRGPGIRRNGRPRLPRGAAVVLGLGVGLICLVLISAVIRQLVGPGESGTNQPSASDEPNISSETTDPGQRPQSAALGTDRVAFNSDRTGNFELFVMDADGGPATQLTDDDRFDSFSPRLSPDRRTMLFYRTPAGTHDRDYSKAALWMASADGSTVAEVRPVGADGWDLQGHAEWSPDGQRLVMFGGRKTNPQLYLTDAVGRAPKALTNRPGQNLDPAYHPDGDSVVFVGCPAAVCFAKDYEIFEIDIADGRTEQITDDDLRDHDPMYSPDGNQLAWLTRMGGAGIGVWDIRVRQPDGNPRRMVNDNGVTSRPEFSADGAWIYTHRLPPSGGGFDVFRMRLDGSQLTNLTDGQPGSNEYPAP